MNECELYVTKEAEVKERGKGMSKDICKGMSKDAPYLSECKEGRKRSAFARRYAADTRGQGTVEYAILVGVLVVIAIIAVIAFRDNLQQLWESISESINSL